MPEGLRQRTSLGDGWPRVRQSGAGMWGGVVGGEHCATTDGRERDGPTGDGERRRRAVRCSQWTGCGGLVLFRAGSVSSTNFSKSSSSSASTFRNRFSGGYVPNLIRLRLFQKSNT